MKPIENQFKIDGYTSRLLWREGVVCLFERTKPGVSEHYEVVILRQEPEKVMFGRIVPAHEAMPGSNLWGTYGWTYGDKKSAKAKFRAVLAATWPADASEAQNRPFVPPETPRA